LRLGFRNRLAGFLLVSLILVQTVTAGFVYSFTQKALVEQGKKQLSASSDLFVHQLDALSQRVAEGVHILSLDFALRQAIALQNSQTVLSALRNHGRRVGATRMRLIALDGTIEGDTLDATAAGKAFGYDDLLDGAAAEGRATAVVAFDGHAYWTVLVPVMAPTPIAYISADIPLDDAMMDTLRQLSSLPREILLVADRGDGKWRSLASCLENAEILDQLLPLGEPPSAVQPSLMNSHGRRDLVLAKSLRTPAGSSPVLVVLGLSLDDAFRQYEPVVLVLVAILAAGMSVALFGTTLIARSVAKPIEALAKVAARIATGDYAPLPWVPQPDEIGQLSNALGDMALAIQEREEHILHQARHDVITGLPNRMAMTDAIAFDLANGQPKPFTLMMIGLPRLQEIVNTVGHDFRDHLMRHVGDRLRRAAAPEGLVARVADSGFAVWQQSETPQVSPKQMIQAVGEIFRQGDIAVDIATAIGIVRVPDHGTDASLLLQRADIALHQALLLPDDRIVFYDPGRDPHRSDHLTLMSDLREALDRNELRLHYQPKIKLAAGRVGGAEALVRWTHARRGFVAPDQFIAMAEETGNIRRLTNWALATGIAQAAEWQRRGFELRLSVNLSVRDLGDKSLPDRVRDLLENYGARPENIVLEITESAIMGEPDDAIAVLRRLADQGIDLSIDDFGVGQSSFTYLRRLPVRELKIDKSFVLNLAESSEDAVIVRSIVELGHNLGYKVTAEGIETEAAMQFLADLGCDYGQGYHMAKALPLDGFEKFIVGGRWPALTLVTS